MSELPVQVRAEAAIALVGAGHLDPPLALSVALWPTAAPVFDDVPTIQVLEFCPKGHPRTAENTYIRKNGWRYCRVCQRDWKVNNARKRRRYRAKVPCSHCGEPAWNPRDSSKGTNKPRCRACFKKHLSEGRKHERHLRP